MASALSSAICVPEDAEVVELLLDRRRNAGELRVGDAARRQVPRPFSSGFGNPMIGFCRTHVDAHAALGRDAVEATRAADRSRRDGALASSLPGTT
jgi:hypothetical protein